MARKQINQGLAAEGTRRSKRGIVVTAGTKSNKRSGSPSVAEKPPKKQKGLPIGTQSRSEKPASRKPAAVIVDSDDEASASDKGITHVSRKAHNKSEPQSEENSDSDKSSDSKEDNNNDDLKVLDDETLKKALTSEKVQWGSNHAKHKQKYSRQSKSASSLAEDNLSSSEPEIKSVNGDHSTDSDTESTRQTTATSSKTPKSRKSSKRELARRAEVPQWSRSSSCHPTVTTSSTQLKRLSENLSDSKNGVNKLYTMVNDSWPAEAHYVPPEPGQQNISLKRQPRALKSVMKAAIRTLIGDAMFESAYPSVTTIHTYYEGILARCAKEQCFEQLCNRIVEQETFVEIIGRVLSVRLSNHRTNAKKVILPKTEGFYSLTGDCRDQIKQMLATTEYIYPKTDAKVIARGKPFRHPIIISSLKEYYFTGARRSLVDNYMNRFTSSLETKPDELEIPAAMVCTIATAVHACLDDWSSGYLKKSDFNADAYEDVYKGHMMFLENIRQGNATAYHRLMADLYCKALAKDSRSANAVADSAMALLNFDEMDV